MQIKHLCVFIHIRIKGEVSSNGRHSGPKIFKPEKNLEIFRLKNFGSRDAYPGKLE